MKFFLLRKILVEVSKKQVLHPFKAVYNYLKREDQGGCRKEKYSQNP